METDGGINKALFERLEAAILDYDDQSAKRVTEEIIEKGIDPLEAMDVGVSATARLLGEKFETGEIFIPHLVMAGEILADVAQILQTTMSEASAEQVGEKTVVIGTVEGDIHTIGKSIVAMLLKANGFKVHDLGVDVNCDEFVKEAQRNQADIIAMSCLLTTTMPYQRDVIEELERLKVRDRFKVLIGGGPITQDWADEIGADGFAKDAVEAVSVAKKLATGV